MGSPEISPSASGEVATAGAGTPTPARRGGGSLRALRKSQFAFLLWILPGPFAVHHHSCHPHLRLMIFFTNY
jgi:hypothetical protein